MMRDIVYKDCAEIYKADVPWDRLYQKRILVTGAYGMLASYVVYFLIYLNEVCGAGLRIVALVRSEEKCRKRFGRYAGKPYFEMCTAPLEQRVCIEGNIDYIIHAASLASPQHYAVRPVDVMLPNTVGNYNLLNLAAEKAVEGFLLFSTGDIYGVVEGMDRIREDGYGRMDTLDIHNCYSESKRMAETMCKAFWVQKNVPAKIARIWHTYAPTMDVENDPRVFASFIKDVVMGRDIEMKSAGTAKRCFCYITDAVSGYFKVLLEGAAGEAYNVCNTEEWYSIAELAEMMTKLRPEYGLRVIRKQRGENENYVENTVANSIPPDNSKLKLLGWNPQVGVAEGFARVLECLDCSLNFS